MAQPGEPAHKWRQGEGAFIRAHLSLTPMLDEDGAPARVRALPWGEVELRDKSIRKYFDEPGTLEVNERSAVEISENFTRRDTDYFVNLGHNARGPAYGWIKDVEAVAGEGIFVDVEWTSEGERLVRDRAYRYSSVEAVLDASAWSVDGSPAIVVAVTGLALTNTPAVIGQLPVAYQSLNAALSASDGRSLDGRHNPPGDPGEKGASRMDGNFFKGLFSRVAGREPQDEVDAATLAAELSGLREKTDSLVAELAGATSKVSELAEKLDEANRVISDYKAAEAERRAADQAAQIEAALSDGKIAPGQVEWAKENFSSFVSLIESTDAGTYGPPKGRIVKDEAINKPDSINLSGDSASLDAEAKVYAREHGIPYHAAVLAVKKLASGKGE